MASSLHTISKVDAPLIWTPILDRIHGQESPVSWIIPDFIPEGSLIALAGEPGTGKSFLSYTLGMNLAIGIPVLGWEFSRPFTVLYFDQENSQSDSTQYLRWVYYAMALPIGSTSLHDALLAKNFHLASFALGSDNWASQAADYVRAVRPQLIIIDTTTPSCNVQDENDNAEATRTIKALRWLMAQTTPVAACLALKHAKVRTDGHGHTLRGAKAWEGSVDSIVFQVRAPWRPSKAQLASGLRATRLVPAKHRAFGLRHPILINPEQTAQGLILHRGSASTEAPAEDSPSE